MKRIRINGKETDTVPVSLYTLAKIAEDIELLWLTDGVDLEEFGARILSTISHISQGAVNCDTLTEVFRNDENITNPKIED